MGEEILNQGTEKLNEILDELNKREVLKKELKEISSNGKKLERTLEDSKKEYEKAKIDDVAKAKEEYISEEVTKIGQTESEIKKIKSNRNKAKQRGIKDRITNETKDLVNENREYHRTIRKTLKENDLPSYCDSSWFYTMYCTQGMKQVLIKMAVFIFTLIIIPLIIVKCTDVFWFFEILLFIAIDVIVITVFITILLLTKDKDNGTLEAMREYRDKISDNSEKIKAIKKNIKLDNDESKYNLDSFDDEIQKKSDKLERLHEERDRKSEEFENEKKEDILKSVSEKYEPIISSNNDDIEKNKTELEKKNEEIAASDKIIAEYGEFIPENILTCDGIKKLITSINEGQAKDIKEAIELAKK